MGNKINLGVFRALLIIFLSFFLQFKIAYIFGIKINFIIASLITEAFFLTFFEFLALDSASILLVLYEPGICLEIVVFGVMPILSFLLRKFMPVKLWLSNFILIIISVFVLYAAVDYNFIMKNIGLFAGDALISAVWGVALFNIMSLYYKHNLVENE